MKESDLIQSVSAASSTNSVPLEIGDLKDYAIKVEFTGADVVGTLKLQASLDDNPAKFVDIDGTSQAVTASEDHLWNVSGAAYRYVRVSWTYASGTGNIYSKGQVKENPIIGA